MRPPRACSPWCCFPRSEEHTSELQSPCNLVCRLLLEKKKTVCGDAFLFYCEDLPLAAAGNLEIGSPSFRRLKLLNTRVVKGHGEEVSCPDISALSSL